MLRVIRKSDGVQFEAYKGKTYSNRVFYDVNEPDVKLVFYNAKQFHAMFKIIK